MSRSDSTAAMLLRIEGDPSGAAAALTEVTAAVEPLQAVIKETTAAALVPMAERVGGFARGEAAEATHALRGMGEEMGVHMPRFISGFIAHLEGVGPALASAFSAVAIIGIVQLLAEQLPKAFEALNEAMTGWDKTAKAAFQEQINTVETLRKALDQYAITLHKATGVGLEGSAKQIHDQQTLNLQIQLTQSRVDGLVEKQRLLQAEAKTISEDMKNSADETGAYTSMLGKQYDVLMDKSKMYDADIEKERESITQLLAEQPRMEAEITAAKVKEEDKRTKETEKAIKERLRQEEEAARINGVLYKQVMEERKKFIEETEKLEQERRKFQFEAEQEYFRESNKGLEEELKEFKKGTDYHVKTIVDQYKEEIRVKKEADKEFEKLDRELEENELRMLRQRQRHFQEFGNIASGVFSHLTGSAQAWAEASVKAFEEVAIALFVQAETENQSLITKAILKAQFYAAQALADLGDFNYFAAAKHGAAAVAFAAMAAAPIISAAAAGGGAHAGAGGGPSGGGGGYGGGSARMAQGTQGGGPQLHIVVMGQGEQAQYFASMLNKGVRTEGVQLAATHAADGTAL